MFFFLLVVSFDVFYFLFCSVFSLTSFHSLLLTKILWRTIQAKRQCIYCLLDLLQYLGLWLVNCHACYKNIYHLKTIINNAIQVVNRYWLQTGRHQPNQFTYILLRINDDEENTCTTWNYGAGFLRMWVRGKGVIIGRFFLSSLDLGMFVILKPIFAGSIWGGEIHWAKTRRAKCCGECALKGNFMKSLNFMQSWRTAPCNLWKALSWPSQTKRFFQTFHKAAFKMQS